MGISLAFLDNLASNLLAFCIILPSVLPLFYCVILPPFVAGARSAVAQPPSARKTPVGIAMALESLKLCGVVVIGFALA